MVKRILGWEVQKESSEICKIGEGFAVWPLSISCLGLFTESWISGSTTWLTGMICDC